MSWSKRTVTLLVVFSLIVGCASRGRRGPEVGVPPTTSVQVENQAFADMTVYVLEGGRRVRLGTVPGISTRTFEIPERLLFGVSSLRFQVDPIGSDQAPISHEITVTAGDTLRLIIPPSIR